MLSKRIAAIALVALVGYGLVVLGQRSQRKTNEQLRTIEQQIVTQTDTIEKLKVVIRHDTSWVRVTVAKADSARDSAQTHLAALDSAAKADSTVPSQLVQEAVASSRDALAKDSVARAATQAALDHTLLALDKSDERWANAEKRATLMERAANTARWTGRKEGAAIGAIVTLAIVHILK
jgi:flagellar biogenesis protein FliO